ISPIVCCWRWVNTRPAAQPSLRANSGVIGHWPAVPRTPSVPKTRSANVVSLVQCINGPAQADGVGCRTHVMRAHDARTAGNGTGSADRAAGQPRLHGALAIQLAEHRLA